MTANHDLERRIADYYASEAPPTAPDWVLESALATIDTTPQRRALRVPWRFPNMNIYAKVAVAAVAVIAVGVIGMAVLRPGSAPGVGGPLVTPSPAPTISPSPSPSPSPSASLLPALDAQFTSVRNGISIAYPADWTIAPAAEAWLSGLSAECDPACADTLYEKETDSPFISVVSQPLAGRTGDQWAAAVLAGPGWDATCTPETEPVTVDGAPGMIAIWCPDPNGLLTALTWTGNRGYLIVLYRIEDRAFFDDLLATVQLRPEDAVDASPSASP